MTPNGPAATAAPADPPRATAMTSAAASPATSTAAPAKAARTVTGYSIPGEGSSTLISVVTVIALLALWWVATHLGWIRDLFLPTPEKIIKAFG
ncbi:MAG TPA: taurine ABC transporter permease, partial [Casimicrobiaceae bacterium]